jgi:hypothetical protein
VKDFFASLGKPEWYSNPPTENLLKGRKFKAEIILEPYVNKDGKNRQSNKIKEFLPMAPMQEGTTEEVKMEANSDIPF